MSVYHPKDEKNDQGATGDSEPAHKLDSGVQLNMENLTKIDEKF